jgi:hypothetical protein
VEYLKVARFVWAPALLANIRLGLKGLPGTNTPAYWAILEVSKKKEFCDYGPVTVKRFKAQALMKQKVNVFDKVVKWAITKLVIDLLFLSKM